MHDYNQNRKTQFIQATPGHGWQKARHDPGWLFKKNENGVIGNE